MLKGIGDIKKIVKLEHKVLLYTPKPEKVLQKLLDKIKKNKEKLVDVSVRKPSLNEVFSSLLKKHVKKNKT